ncbi:MAG TPA: peptidylprolyl isomerase [Candidatus Hydrogenedentes bacterium]|jgi:parvulin-like peptidyl-prolyl isomerase|nr:peptidylprolyl isomerase [Candidatus Hydrogenedentota bacterium]HOD94061.1 peptidylprolyl isomerase [Candidatus Hydrogenedentota bacterium]HOH43026.1 peptidylprolyl isomerase [Candidatus Hydrogenedentota bacterium]HOR49469.1 peptidylprolyl isomerase [Candidatus Hydrogenedentota bacterium]HPK24391.1 peptidylprolyl isomerase [Candidatus Hydrogenedentota bacterium]
MMDIQEKLKNWNEETVAEDPRDYTKLIWLGVGILIVAMMFFLYSGRTTKPLTTSVHVRHILVSFDPADPVDRGKAHDRILELKKRLEAGESFDKLARKYSDDTASAKRGGDLGWAPKGIYAAPFDEYCWTGNIGAISDVILTNFGFHLVQIEERYIAGADLYEKELEKRALEKMKEEAAKGVAP